MRKTITLTTPNDNTRRRFEYRRSDDGGIERRVLDRHGREFRDDGSPWVAFTCEELARMLAQRGTRHPILDPLKFEFRDWLMMRR